jgi:hypothetical protein
MPRQPTKPRLPLDRLAWMQDGVVTRHQLREHGYDDDHVRAQVAARRWTAHGHSVVVLHNGPLTERQQRWVAVLAHPGGALAGVTAAGELGLTGFSDPTVHVIISHGSRPHPLPGIRVRIHVSRRFGEQDLHPGRALPTVRLERGLVDAAGQTRLPRRACALFAAGVQQRLTTAPRLKAELCVAGPMRHRSLLTNVLDDIAGGAHSFAEIDVGRLACRAGLPPPLRQRFRLDRAGRRRWLDAEFDGFFVEIDGAVHLRPISYWDDMERQNDLVIVTGRPILRFATVAIRLVPHTVESQLQAAAARFGRLAS